MFEDAERYRWLRDGWHHSMTKQAMELLGPLSGTFPGGLDAWLDRCMKEMPRQEVSKPQNGREG